MLVNKLLFVLGARFRNPSLLKKYQELKKTEFSSKSDLRKLQFDRLKAILVFAYNYSPFYRNSFKQANFNPLLHFRNLDDISLIPIISKAELLESNSGIHTTELYNFRKLFKAETSGSTGQSLGFQKDEEWDSYHRASIYRGMSWYGVEPWDRHGYFWGFSFSPLKKAKTIFYDFLVNRFRIFSYENSDLARFIKKLDNASYISGYSSMIYEVAKVLNNKNVKLDNLKLVKATSEKIFPHYNDESFKAFGLKMTSEYGSAESSIIAFECPEGSMHINEETCFVEEVDGEIVVTNLVARSFPTIRYKLGDYIKLSNSKCDCGRSHRILSDITGRVGANIIGVNDIRFPSLTLYYVFKNLALNNNLKLNYRVEQRQIGVLDVFISEELNEKHVRLVISEFNRYFKGTVIVNIKDNTEIHQKNRKLKDFTSYLGV